MNNETKNADTTAETNAEANGAQADDSAEKFAELVKAVYTNGIIALKTHFDDVEGRIMNHENYGPLFLYRVKDESDNGYACGFFLRELVAKFQSGNDPALWMSSFFVELMRNEGGKELPEPPAGEEDAKAIIDKSILPMCYEAIREEFEPEQVHSGLDWHKDYGPVLEAGFPQIKDGNNVCAVPLHLLMAHYLLNRDPSEVIVQGLYKIREENGLK